MNREGPGATQVQQLLDELCTDLGFCLPPREQERLRQSPPHGVGAFADAVFAAEGMDPRLDKQLYRQVCERIERRTGQWVSDPHPDLSTQDSPATCLADRFIESAGSPVELAGRLVHMMAELPPIMSATTVRIDFHDLSPARPQALRVKTRGGKLQINRQSIDDLVLWSDSAPRPVTATVSPDKAGTAVTVRLWNAWRDPLGVMQAWIGNAGMLIEPTANGVLLRCSDGYDEPSFNDLVVEITATTL